MRKFILGIIIVLAVMGCVTRLLGIHNDPTDHDDSVWIVLVLAIIGSILYDIKDTLNNKKSLTDQLIDKLMRISEQENHEKKTDTTDASN